MTREEMIDAAVRTAIGPFTMREMVANANRWRLASMEFYYMPNTEIIRAHFTRIAAREAKT
jgi:hypothetical protein